MIDGKPDLLAEAEEAAKEIAFGVISASVSSSSSPEEALIDVKILEGESLVISLTERGFRVVERKNTSGELMKDSSIRAETIHALMDQLSPLYRDAFAQSLAAKLASLAR